MTDKKNFAEVSVQLYELLEPFAPEERHRLVKAVTILFGDSHEVFSKSAIEQENKTETETNEVTPLEFFAEKGPKNKGEELAVAARFLEQYRNVEEYSKDDLKQVVGEASRNFDDKNFTRDMDNAKRTGGLFIKGTTRGINRLSYYGKEFVDALPNREVMHKLRKPKTKSSKVKTKKAVSKSK